MMLCLLKPVIDIAGAGKYMDASYIINQMKNEWEVIAGSGDLRDMKDDIQKEYDDAIEEQVTDLGTAYHIIVTDVRVRWGKRRQRGPGAFGGGGRDGQHASDS